MKIIWSMGESDPTLNENGTLIMNWHGPDNRGIQNALRISQEVFTLFRVF